MTPTDMTPTAISENRRIARAAGLVAGLTLLSRVAGLVRDATIGYVFGTGAAADAFFVAFRIPNLLRRLVAEGALSVAFVPVFTDYLTTRTPAEALRAARALVTAFVLVLLPLTVAGILLSPWLVALFAPGFSTDPEKLGLTIGLTRWLFPYVLLVSLVALLGGLLNSLRHFTAPALSPVLLNLAIIAASLLLCPRLADPVYGLAYGALIGGSLQILVHLVPLWWRRLSLGPLWQPRHPAIRRVLTLMAPSVFGAAVYQINIMMSTIFASLLPAGSVAYLWYADRVFEFPLGLFAVALSTAALPSFSAQASRGAHAELRRSVAAALGMLTFITLPATAGLLVLALPITAVLFGRGAFGAPELAMTARALQAFAVGLWAVSLVRVLVPVFYALGDTRTPVLSAALAFVANMAFSLMLMGPVGAAPAAPMTGVIAAATHFMGVWNLRHAGLALATSLAAAVNLGVLGLRLSRRLAGFDFAAVARSFLRSLAASLVMTPAVYATAHTIDWSVPGRLSLKAVTLALSTVIGVVVFTGASRAFGGEEILVVMRLLRERLSPRGRRD